MEGFCLFFFKKKASDQFVLTIWIKGEHTIEVSLTGPRAGEFSALEDAKLIVHLICGATGVNTATQPDRFFSPNFVILLLHHSSSARTNFSESQLESVTIFQKKKEIRLNGSCCASIQYSNNKKPIPNVSNVNIKCFVRFCIPFYIIRIVKEILLLNLYVFTSLDLSPFYVSMRCFLWDIYFSALMSFPPAEIQDTELMVLVCMLISE